MKHNGVVAAPGFEDARPGDVIGWWRGREIRLLGGGAPDDDQDDQGGEDDDQDDGSVFDDQDDSGGSDGGDDDDSGDEDLSPAMRRLIQQEANRIADRRINQALDRNRDRRRQGRDRDRDRDDRGGRDQDRGRSGSGQVDAGVLREGRLVYREFVGDEIRFVSSEERQYANDLASSLLADRLGSGDDVETAGREVAREVANRTQEYRRSIERQVVARLQSRGVIPKDYRAGSQPRRGGAAPDEKSGMKKGEDRARRLRPERFPTDQSA